MFCRFGEGGRSPWMGMLGLLRSCLGSVSMRRGLSGLERARTDRFLYKMLLEGGHNPLRCYERISGFLEPRRHGLRRWKLTMVLYQRTRAR